METASRDQLLEQLLSGYESLSLEAKMLHEQRRELENKLSWAKQQVCELSVEPLPTRPFPASRHITIDHMMRKHLALDL